MKPPPFDYARPSTLEEALDLLRTPGAKALAGGQSLLPLLNLRLAAPTLLVDVAALPGLDAITSNGSGLTMGALVRHHRMLDAPIPLLAQAARHIGHVAIRNRGTLGGSLVHADPTAELATAAVALDAELRLTARAGDRTVRAREFFQGPFMVDLAEDELLTEIAIPPRPHGERSAFLEVAPRQGDFAIVGVAVLARIEQGALTGVTVAWSGAGPMPVRADELAAALEGA
ncbi:MAG: FAD binding domain-containing protein, partial [bacterium]|nr:FAD binding domain-containing protein [bacterium]